MSTLAEIEKAIATLPVPEQRELYQHLGAQISRGPAPAEADKRAAVARFLRRWTGAGRAAGAPTVRSHTSPGQRPG